MDVLSDDQVLQANLGQLLNERRAVATVPGLTGVPDIATNPGRYSLEGFDNEALDFQQLEDFINNDVNNIFPPEDPSAVCYGGGRGMDPATMGHKGPTGHPMPAHTGMGTHYPTGPPMAHNNASQHMAMNKPQHAPHTQQHYGHPQLPDSPPDSSSEPYSPDNGNQSAMDQSCTMKAGMVGSLNSIPQQLYPHSHGAPGHPAPGHSLSPPNSHGAPIHTLTPPHHHSHPSPPSQMPGKNPYSMYNNGEPPKLNHMPTTGPGGPMAPGGPVVTMPQVTPDVMQQHYSSMNNTANQPNKKRKYSDSPNSTVTPGTMNPAMLNGLNGLLNIKQEPGALSDCVEDDFPYDMSSDANSGFLDGVYQVIKWQAFTPNKWCSLLDGTGKELTPLSYRVDADKGFNFSLPDEAFVCQKKNHFQITVHVSVVGEPKFVKSPEGTKKIDSYHVHFFGIKMESPTQFIKVEQSQSDRSKKPFHPVKVELQPDQVTKLTVGRLHFSETTSNNMRKKGKPNPDQRYFMLVVAFQAHCGNEVHMIAAHVSERIIVRASNPGQFDSDVDVLWQKGQTPESVFHAGRVGVNTDRPDEALTVHGNMKLTGHILQPSDQRVKENFEELDPKEQLKNVAQLKVYKYNYNDDFVDTAGMSEDEKYDTGVLAQELKEVLPDAVRETGDLTLSSGERLENFLIVNKDRIYMENVGAVKELCKLTDNLENRIDELERMNKKLAKLKRIDSLKSTMSTRSLASCSTISRANSIIPRKPTDDTSSVAGSVLTTATTAQKSTVSSHRHKPRQRPPSCASSTVKPSEQDLGGCSNRFIQGTVIVLVLVMAFCLVSITTLYIMEKQESQEPMSSSVALGSPNSFTTSSSPTTSLSSHKQHSTTTTTTTPTPSTTTMQRVQTEGAQLPPNMHGPGHGTDAGDQHPVPPGSAATGQRDGNHGQQGPSLPGTTSTPRTHGPPGYPGGTGFSGTAGRPGLPGPAFRPGERGDQGPAGPAGEMGTAGHAGQAGPPPPERPPATVPPQPEGPFSPAEILPTTSLPESLWPVTARTIRVPTRATTARGRATTEPPWHVTPPEDNGTFGNGTNSTDHPGLPTLAPGEVPPLISYRCQRNPSRCTMVCCERRPLDDPHENPNDLPNIHHKEIKNDKEINSATVDTNKTFVLHVSGLPSGNPSYSHVDEHQQSVENSQALMSDDKMTLEMEPIDQGAANPSYDSPLVSLDYVQDDYDHYRHRRSIDPDTAPMPSTRPQLLARILIVQNNQSIDSLFCVDDPCREMMGGNYSYRIPISQYFPEDSVIMKFIVEPGLQVAYCLWEKQQPCDYDDLGHHHQIMSAGPDQWDLPVGYYFASTYRFRVASTTQSNICSLADQEVGQTFAEYSLYFQRAPCPADHIYE